MGGSDGLLCAGEELVETVLTTGQDRTPGTGPPTVLLALPEDVEEVSLTNQQGHVLTSHSDNFNKIRLRNSSHDRDIFQVSLQEACHGYLLRQISD